MARIKTPTDLSLCLHAQCDHRMISTLRGIVLAALVPISARSGPTARPTVQRQCTRVWLFINAHAISANVTCAQSSSCVCVHACVQNVQGMRACTCVCMRACMRVCACVLRPCVWVCLASCMVEAWPHVPDQRGAAHDSCVVSTTPEGLNAMPVHVAVCWCGKRAQVLVFAALIDVCLL